MRVTANTTIEWSSNGGTEFKGWKMCFVETSTTQLDVELTAAPPTASGVISVVSAVLLAFMACGTVFLFRSVRATTNGEYLQIEGDLEHVVASHR